MRNVTIFREPGRYAGWPANYGIWSWGNEVVVGFTVGYFKADVRFHARDQSKPFVTMQARSLDGGNSWEVIEHPAPTPGRRALSADEHMNSELHIEAVLDEGANAVQEPPGNIDFTHPDFALICARSGLRAGARSWFYYSYDRCHTWQGPYSLPMFGQCGIAARTDYMVSGKDTCTFFLTAAKPNGDEGRVFCARTMDGGKWFKFLSWVTPEPEGYTIMPASVALSAEQTLVAVRCSGARVGATSPNCWIDLYASDDSGENWKFLNRPVPSTGLGGNPPTLTELHDGRLCLTYGYRDAPFGIHALLSEDEGRTWSEPIILREDGGNHDIGYPRTVQLPDETMLTAYYYNDEADGDRYIAATLWKP